MIVQELFASLGLQIDQSAFDRGTKFLGKLKMALSGVVAFLGVRKIYDMVEGVVALGDAASNTAQSVGMTAEQLQQYQYIGKIANVSSEEMQMGLMYLSRGMQELKLKGTGPAADALKELGVQFKQLDGKSVDDQIQIIADAFAKMPDGSKKTAAAMELFSRSGARIIPFLNTGAEGIRQLKQEAIDLGFVIDNKTADAMNNLRDQGDRLEAAWQGIKNQAVEALVPALRKIADEILAWVKANRQLISMRLQQLMQLLITLFNGLVTAARAAVQVFAFLGQHMDLTITILQALGVALAAFAVQAAVAWVAALGPMELIIVVLAAITAGVIYLVHHWDKVKEAGAKAWGAIKQAAVDFGEYILSLPGRLFDAVVDIGHAIENAFIAAFHKVEEVAMETWKRIRNTPIIKQVIDVGEKIKGYLEAKPSAQRPVTALDRLTQGPYANPYFQRQGVTMSAKFGDVHVDVHAAPGMDEHQLSDLVGLKVQQHQQQQVQQAMDALRGGRR